MTRGGRRCLLAPERLRRDAGFWAKLHELCSESEIANLALVSGARVGVARALDVLDVREG